ncbi:MAG: retropepsin-like aspartic protease family protein [Gammaproteobacteria bacterium]
MQNQQPNPTRGMGNTMTILAWIVFLLMLTILFSNYTDRQHNPNREVSSRTVDGQTEVRLLQNSQGHYLANGAINDEPVTFMLDTGATLISVPSDIAYRLGLREGPLIDVNTANGPIRVPLTRLEKVRLGDIELYDVKAAINPHADDDTILLGMSFLKDLELVQRNDELIIKRQ